MGTISLDSIVQRPEALISTAIEDDAVLMDIDTGNYFALEGVAARIWSIVENPISVESLCAQLVGEYQVDAMQCEREVLGFVSEATSAGFIELIH